MIKDNLFMYGYLAHPRVKEIDLSIAPFEKNMAYTLYLDTDLLKIRKRFDELSGSKSLWDLWRLRRLIKKHGNLNLESTVSRMIRDYLGPGWVVAVSLKDVKEYSPEMKSEQQGSTENQQVDQQPRQE